MPEDSTPEKLDFFNMSTYSIKGCSESIRSCLRCTIIFMNIPIAIMGLISLSVGLWVMVSDTPFFDLTADVLNMEVLDQAILRKGAIVMVSVGAAMLILAGLGVIGALTMNSVTLSFYVLPLIVLLTLEAAVMVLAVVFKSEWEARTNHLVAEELISQYGDSVDSSRGSFTWTLNTLQQKMYCCGWESGWDYQKVDRGHWNTTLPNGEHRQVPDSCCVVDNTTEQQECVVNPYNSSTYSTMGCREAVETQFRHYQWIVVGVTITTIAFQFVLVLMTLLLLVQNVSHKYDMR